MNLTSWLLFGVLACLVCILVVLVAWLRISMAFLREYHAGQEAMKKLLLGNFSDLLEALRIAPADDERGGLSQGPSHRRRGG
jgi:hypothetical protein